MLLRSVARLLPFALLLGACAQDEAPTSALPTAPDGGLVVPDAALLLLDGGQGDTSAPAAAEPLSGLLTLAEFRGEVTADGAMVITTLDPAASSDARLRRLAQGLCTLSIVQDGVAGTGPANSLELVTGTTGLDGACEGYLASPLFCGAVTVRSFYATAQTQVFAQIQSLVPSTGFGVQNGDVVPGASSGLGSWAYGDLGAASSSPGNSGVRNWVFARSGGNFTFTGRVVANVTELCDGLDNDCDGATDEGIGCRTQGQSCAATVDCSGALVCTGGLCSPAGCPSGEHVEAGACASDTRSCSPLPSNTTAGTQTWTGSAYGSCTATTCASGYNVVAGACLLQSTLGTACTLNAECASGFCATGPDGTANDRCAPTDMTYIPAGTFTMGSPLGELGQETDETEHSVTLSRSFFVGQTEVTQGQWKALSSGTNPSCFQSTTGTGCTTSNANDSGPVENLDWYAAVAFANARSAAEGLTSCYTLTGCTDAANGWQDGLHSGCTAATLVGLTCTGYRLPTESEWEYAARGGTTTATYMGDLSGTPAYCDSQANLDGIAWWCVNGGSRSQAVGGKTANSFGLYDMLGNVWEWTGEWYGAYPATVTDPTGPATGDGRVPRGGSYGNNAGNTRAAVRLSFESFNRVSNIGFRLSKTVTRGCAALPVNATAGVEAANATGWGACEATTCATSYHVDSGTCASDSRSCSSADATAATETWTGAEYGPCTASGCLPTHHVDAGVCQPNTESCPVTNGNGSRTYNAGAWSSCTLAGCNAGYHVQSGACELDTRSCTLADGTGSQSWLGSEWGECTPTSCDTGYHVESGGCASDARSCLLTGGAGNQTWNGNSWNGCIASACYGAFTLNAGSCVASGCGNGLVEAGEGCDDGNLVATDGCTASCAVAACGDGLVQAGVEGCDDGNTLTEECNYGAASCTVCTATCTSAAGETDLCSDGILDAAEVCDDGNVVDDDSCANSCLCGAGYHVESGVCTSDTQSCALANATVAFETWSESAFGACTATACAATYHVEGGACLSATRACSVANATTATQSWTGSDYTVCAATGCDAGYSLLAGACAAAGCGNGAAEAGEACDDGNTVATDGCTSTCTVAACGDGVVQAGVDGCDDGNTLTEECGYGAASCTVCSATCTSVAGETDICGDGILDGAEVCDDGNGVNGDSCNDGCVCGTGFHFEGGVCTSDTRSCLLANGTGTEQWNSLSYGSTCSVATCDSGYHVAANSCAANVVSCTLANATAATQTWSSGTISYGSCTANSCAASYHVESGACAANVRVCTLANGTATETWDSGTRLYGSCTPGVCNSGYHIEDGACLSNIRSCSPLPANTTAGTQTYASSAWGGCTATTCALGYWANAGVCVLKSTLGTACTLDAACASGFCATGPTGTANDRCAPTGMNYIPAGTFTMGSYSTEVGRNSDERQHYVTISRSFFMAQTEATQGQWKALSGDLNPSWFQSTTGTVQTTTNANDSGPVENLDWYAAIAFANARSAAEGLTSCYTLTGCTDAAIGWKDGIHSGCTGATFAGLNCTGYRLPTESEWEYAARAGTTTATYGGNLSATSGCVTLSGTGSFAAGTAFGDLAWYVCNAASRTQATGGKLPNTFGLYDMLGNVREWTGDWYDLYSSTDPPTGPTTGSDRVIRGGSLYRPAENTRAASRHRVTPANRYDYLGFRLARTVTRGCTTLPANATAGVEAATATGWGACEATACATSYHVESGLCVSNTRTCSPMPAGTTAGTQTYASGAWGGCTATTCASGYWLSAGACLLPSPLGIACTLNAQCASGVCATGPDGTANDRCAPTGMNYIPAGTFTMGSPPGEVGQGWDETQHSVTISRSFFMAQTEVTQLEWKALSGGINPSARRSDSRPVENPDWYAALAFANARSAAEGLTSCYALAGCTDATNGWQDGLHSSCTGATLSGLTCTGYRLPTESEWEYAARAGTSTATYLGNLSAPGTGCTTPQANLDGIAWWCRNAYGSTQAVASKAANSFGLFDMLGNVSEWTGDLYGAYPGTVTDPTGPTTGSSRVHRGGSWYDTGHDTRAAGLRRNVNPDYPSPQKGFRLVRTVTRGCAALPANATAGVEAANASGWGACEVVACATGYVVNAGACIPDNLGTSCTANAQCAAGNCATGPDGTANDRCAPTGMNYIPAGTFTMGSPSEELGRYTDETQHSVTISRRFFLGQTEVTQGQWKALSGGTNPSYFQSTTGEFSSANDNDNGPVEQLDWYSAVAFANARSAAEGLASCYTLTGCTDAAIGWKDGLHSGCWGATFSGPACTGYRLPTESEWEYAARAVTTTATYAGNLSGVVLDCTTAQANLEGIAWWCRSSGRRTQATGSKLPNTFGLFDMLGNVYEWVGDWYGAYPGTVTDPTGATSGLYRGMRGGSLINEPRAVRSAWRDGTTPDSRNRIRGLRLARTVP